MVAHMVRVSRQTQVPSRPQSLLIILIFETVQSRLEPHIVDPSSANEDELQQGSLLNRSSEREFIRLHDNEYGKIELVKVIQYFR